jgi:hypothetical protein
MPQLDERAAVIATLGAIRESRARLLQQRDALSERLAEQDQLERYWQNRLGQLENAEAGRIAKRVKKGEPLRRLLDVYGESDDGFSIAELVAKTALGQSTVNATLKREGSPFQERGGRWFHSGNRTSAPLLDAVEGGREGKLRERLKSVKSSK